MNNTPADLTRKLAAIKQVLGDRVEIYVDVIEPDGTCSERIHRGHFQRNPGPVATRPIPPTRQEKRT